MAATPYSSFRQPGIEEKFDPIGSDRLSGDKGYVGDLKNQKWGQQNQGMFDNNLERMRNTMNGVGPSHGVNTLQAANQRTNAGLFSGAASARGAGGLGMASMNAANRSAANNQRVGNESEMIRAMEADAARKGMFNAINQNRADTIAGESARYGAMNSLGESLTNRERAHKNMGIAEQEFYRDEANFKSAADHQQYENQLTQQAMKDKAKKDLWTGIGQVAVGTGGKLFRGGL